jgi:hypothetical protein
MPSAQIILSHLNQPFYPTLHQSAPELIGVGETKPSPNPLGFAAAFEACKDKDIPDLEPKKKENLKHAKKQHKHKHLPSSSESSSSDSCSTSSDSEYDDPLTTNRHIKPLPKTVRDLELALTANWRTISSETESFIGKPRQQLENRSGMEVAVMTL